jgi:hypothetical protein
VHTHLRDVLSRLDHARAGVRSAVDAIPAGLHRQKPAPDRWSAAEVVEHLSITERIFSGRIAAAIDGARQAGLSTETSDRTPLPDSIEQRMADRGNRRTAPEPAQPTGAMDLTAAWLALEGGHDRLRALVSSVDGLALGRVTVDHPFFGTMTVYQWIELMAAHEGRHTEQIKEIALAVTKA